MFGFDSWPLAVIAEIVVKDPKVLKQKLKHYVPHAMMKARMRFERRAA